MPSRTTRSGRTVKNSATSQSKLDALELLARQRRGEKVDNAVKEDEPLFEDVDEEEYKRTRKGGFIEDDDSEEGDSDLEFIDDDNDEEQPRRKKRSREIEIDPKQRTMKSFLAPSSSKAKSSHSSNLGSQKKKQVVNEDDILSQMLFDVPINKASSAQKPLKVLSRISTPQRPLKTKATTTPSSIKRVRMDSPIPDDGVAFDDFDDEFITNLRSTDPPKNQISQPKVQTEQELDLESDHVEPEDTIVATPLKEDVKSNLEFHETEDGRTYTRLYWYDCSEDQRNPGVVYFFGKVHAKTTNKYVSCCTIVKNIQRTCYLMIKENSNYAEALEEFSNITAKQHKIKNFKCERATKKYAFGSDSKIPLIADYLKVEYPANQASLPTNIEGETFYRALNVNQSSMEKLILELKLRGPCWLRLIDPVASDSQLTWTKIELVLEKPQNLVVDEGSASLATPYFSAFSLSLRTYPNPTTHQNEIIAIACMVNTAFNLDQCLKRTNKASGHFCIMAKPASGHKELKLPYDFQIMAKKQTKTRLEVVESERDLLLRFMEKFGDFYDPDIVIGHDLLNFDYETLAARMKALKVGSWSQLGRFRRTELPSTKSAFRYMFSGRILCDIRTSAMELIRSRSYDLTELAHQLLDRRRVEFNHALIVESFKASENLLKLLNATWEDTDSIFSILVELNVIPLALKITNITGNILSRTLAAGRSERNEYLLLHAFHEDNFICPEKQWQSKFSKKLNSKSGDDERAPLRKKAAYTGGLVLDPKAGYYDTCVLLMDFNSLYPSIIQEFNICFSTVKVPDYVTESSEVIAKVPEDSVEIGILPAQLRKLVDGRRRVKKLLAESKSADQKLMLDIEQKALKLTANSMYGCLGFEHSRFYAKHLASLVTFKGREILMSTKAIVEKLGYEVIYGDTDSLMINTKLIEYDEVIQRGTSIKEEINRCYKLLEIDIDGVYRPLLLLKKKNYAGATIKKLPDGQLLKEIETKGLDTVRRDRAVIAKEAGDKVLSMILSGEHEIDRVVEDIHNYLKVLGSSIVASEVAIEKFLISKQLNRNPEEYKVTKGIGHVTLALRHNNDKTKTRKLKANDTVEYVICLDGTNESANQRAYTLEELASNPNLKLDYEYYLCQQIHPVMARICDKLPITNAYVLAEMLGIEKSCQLHIKREESTNQQRDQLLSKGESRFHSCKPLVISCSNCNSPSEITKRTRRCSGGQQEYSLTSCSECGFCYALKPRLVTVQVIDSIRRLTIELYSGRFVCENPECDYQTRNVVCPLTSDLVSDAGSGSSATKVLPLCALCDAPMQAAMDDRKMDLQLGFMKHLFDTKREVSGGQLVEPREDLLEMYESCSKEIDYALRNSFINTIDAHSMFKMICSGY